MKTAPEPKEVSASVTSKAKLTIHGQVHELTMEELNSLYDQIHKALGKDKVPTMPWPRDKARERPFYPPPAQWHTPAPAPYLDPSTRPMCFTV